MLAKEIIEKNRKSFEELNQYHLDAVRSNGAIGCFCLNYDEFLKTCYNLTDKEIILKVLEKGGHVDDAEEFLALYEEKEKKGD